MVTPMMGIGRIMIFKVEENSCGPMVNNMMANGLMAKWRVKVPLYGMMEVNMLDYTKMI